ncbi:hypothetical protein ACWDTP_32550 [Mycobacterium sp. NPDC003449]
MRNLAVAVAGSAAVGFAIGAIRADAPPAVAAAPPAPVPGVYAVTETAQQLSWAPYEWTLSDCGPECLHVLSHSSDNNWQLDLAWSPAADGRRGAWVGERTNPGMGCQLGTAREHQTGPFTMKYIIRPDLTGFINMGFSQNNPSCAGETDARSRQLALRRAPSRWS